MEWMLLIGLLIGRIIFGGFFIFSGLNHFMNLGMMSGYAESKGTPAPQVAVAGSGVMLLAGGLSVVLGVLPVIGLILITIVPVAGFVRYTRLLGGTRRTEDERANSLHEEHGTGRGGASTPVRGF